MILFGKTVNPKTAGVVSGAALGFVIGGPAGAALGALAGYGGGAYIAEKTGFVAYQPFNRFTAAQVTAAIVPGSAPILVNNQGGQKVTTLQIATLQTPPLAAGTNPPPTAIITLNPVSVDVSNPGRFIGIVAYGSAAGTPQTQLDFQASEVMAMGSPNADGSSGLTWDQGNV